VEEIALSKIATVQQGYTFKPEYQGSDSGKWMYVKVGDLNSQGNIKYVTRTQNYINDDALSKIKAKPFSAGSIVFSRVGAALRLNNKRILTQDCLTDDNVLVITVTNKAECYSEFLYYWFESKDLQRFCNDGSVPVISGKNLKKQIVSLPSLSEQTAIAFLLSTWDTAIEKSEKLIEAKEKRFKGLLIRLISNDKHPRGHIRDFTSEVSKRNNGQAADRVLSVTNNRGFVLPEDQFERRVASSDLSNYKIVTHEQYAYNPSRINVGSIARLDNWDKGVLSPMYVVFKVNEKKVTSDFFLHWLSSHEAKARIRRSAQGSVRETVSFADLGAIPFPLPSLAQQQQIAETLNTARQEIDLLKKQAEAYRKQKRGLMQKLLTGQWRVKINDGETMI
jgi:type I restriction enzyme S subunit